MTGPDRLVIGRIAKAHGIRGEVAVDVLTESHDRFEPGATLLIGGRVLTVEDARPHQGRMLVKFSEVLDRTEAERLRGAKLEIFGTEARELDEWSFYPWQLEGCAVVDAGGGALGTLVRVEEGPAHDLWVVEDGGREVLVPAVRAFVVAVDTDGKRVVLDPPEGLF